MRRNKASCLRTWALIGKYPGFNILIKSLFDLQAARSFQNLISLSIQWGNNNNIYLWGCHGERLYIHDLQGVNTRHVYTECTCLLAECSPGPYVVAIMTMPLPGASYASHRHHHFYHTRPWRHRCSAEKGLEVCLRERIRKARGN